MRFFSEPRWKGFDYRLVTFNAADGTKLFGWYFPAVPSSYEPGPKRGIVIQFHGNAENMSSHYAFLSWVTRHGYDFFTFDYRGYGGSEGSPSPAGVHQDAIAAIRTVIESHPQGSLALYGQSLGGAILLRALADLREPEIRSRVCSVIVEGSFANYKRQARRTMANHWFSWIFQPLGALLVSNEYAPEDFISLIAPLPLLVIHGTEDSAVTFENGEEIYALAKDPKEFWRIEGGKHLDTMVLEDGVYQKKLINYLGSHCPHPETKKN